MENKQERTSRFSDAEYGVMKTLFRDTDELLYLIRKIFFFGGLNDNEMKQAEVFRKEEVFSVLKRTFVPEICETDPYQQLTDTWLTLDLKDKMPSEVEVNIQARKRTNEMMRDAVERLKSPSSEKLSVLSYEPDEDSEENHISLVARNTFINGTTIQLANLKVMSKKGDETEEEKAKRLKANSSK
jgi:hypothetical protein